MGELRYTCVRVRASSRASCGIHVSGLGLAHGRAVHPTPNRSRNLSCNLNPQTLTLTPVSLSPTWTLPNLSLHPIALALFVTESRSLSAGTGFPSEEHIDQSCERWCERAHVKCEMQMHMRGVRGLAWHAQPVPSRPQELRQAAQFDVFRRSLWPTRSPCAPHELSILS